MNSAFTIRDWSAFAPGLTHKAEWMAWAAEPFLPQGEATPALPEMPPMLRRRVDKLGRMALQVAWWCQQGQDENVPLVFASRHGDLARTYEMLRSLAHEQPLSPTHFGLSTHNAIAAQYSIARNLGSNCVCVSAGTATAEAAIIEALGLLADGIEADAIDPDGIEEVLVVVYDCPLPEGYASYADEPEAAFAWTARIGRAAKGDVLHTLQVDADPIDVAPVDADPVDADPVDATQVGVDAQPGRLLPHGLEVLRFLIGGQSILKHRENGRSWRWRKHA
ncbi:MAG TPA: beta-ketoacyl synthase chain length factor [Xanthomonadaceae bacterium]|nr:beta-ketoacyl synthase chain length factor [Xanthomonadaceae bacterium]